MQNGISPLIGETGRAIQASIAHLPPDQQQQYLTSAAQNGLVPFPIAVALNAALRLKEPLVQAPAPGNVVSDMVQKLSGQPAAPQMPMPQQPQVDPRMAAGIATLSAPNMGQTPQGMAGGGIVSFSGGGGWMDDRLMEPPRGPIPASASAAAADSDSELIIPGQSGNSGLAELFSIYGPSPEQREEMERLRAIKEPNREEMLARGKKEFDEMGLGKADRERLDALIARGEKNKARFEKEGRYATAKGFFEAAAEAAQPGTTFLGAISRGLGNYAGAKGQMSDKMEAAAQALEDQQYAVKAAQENMMMKRTDYAKTEYEKEVAKYERQREQLMSMLSDQQKSKATIGAAQIRANAKGASGSKSPDQVYSPRIEVAQNNLDQVRYAFSKGKATAAEVASAEQALALVRSDYAEAKKAQNAVDARVKQQNLVEARKQIAKERSDTSTQLGQKVRNYAIALDKYNKSPTQENRNKATEAAKAARDEEDLIWTRNGFDPAEIRGTANAAASAAPAGGGGGGNYALTPEMEALAQQYGGGG